MALGILHELRDESRRLRSCLGHISLALTTDRFEGPSDQARGVVAEVYRHVLMRRGWDVAGLPGVGRADVYLSKRRTRVFILTLRTTTPTGGLLGALGLFGSVTHTPRREEAERMLPRPLPFA